MDERRRLKARQAAATDPLSTLRRTVLGDPLLAERLVGTLAALGSAGAAAGIGVALLSGSQGGTPGWLVVGTALVFALLLAGLALLRRRDPREGRNAPQRSSIGLALLAVVAVAATVRTSPLMPPLAWGVALLLAIGTATLGHAATRRAIAAVRREVAAQRQGWYAQIRASRLTRRMLGYPAYRQLRRDGALPIKSGVFPGRTYLVPIRTTPSGARILVLDGERPVGGLCLRPREPLPDPEEALTHILAIRTDERAWLGRANFFPQDRALTPQALGLAPGRPGNYER